METFPSRARLESDRVQADEIYRIGQTIRVRFLTVLYPVSHTGASRYPLLESLPLSPTSLPPMNLLGRAATAIPITNTGGIVPSRSLILVPIRITLGLSNEVVHPVMRGAETGEPGFIAWMEVGLTIAGSDELHSIHAPHSSRCDLCLVSFCGVGIPRRCVSLPLMAQVPEGLSELEQLLSCEEIVDLFNGNLVERDYLIDHAQANELSPIQIYRDVTSFSQAELRNYSGELSLDPC